MIEFDFATQSASAEWLSQTLAQNGYLDTGSVVALRQEVSQVDAGASATIYQLTPEYSEGSTGRRPGTLLMKVAMSGETEGFEQIAVRYAAWLFLPQSHRYAMLQKEPVFYEAARGEAGTLPLIECFGSATDPANHSTCLLLADISSSHYQPPWPIPPGDEQCRATMTAVARLHAHWWNNARFGDAEFPLITNQLVDEVLAVYADAYDRFEAEMGDRLSASRRAIYRMSLARLPGLLKERLIDSGQLTLAHGDAHHWNMLIPKSGEEVVIFDWQTWHVDLGAHDLAYLMGVGWFPEHRDRLERELLRHYLDALNMRGVQYDWQQLVSDYRLSIIRHLFTPVIFSSFITPAVWWSHLERIFCTFESWGCKELLD